MKDESLWYATDFKMRVYGMKDESLWYAVRLKMRVYGKCYGNAFRIHRSCLAAHAKETRLFQITSATQ